MKDSQQLKLQLDFETKQVTKPIKGLNKILKAPVTKGWSKNLK